VLCCTDSGLPAAFISDHAGQPARQVVLAELALVLDFDRTLDGLTGLV